MTTILWQDGYLLCDSAMVKGKERFQSLTKVQKFTKPVKMVSKQTDELNDTIFGWIATGNNEVSEKFMEFLVNNQGNVDTLCNIYYHMVRSMVANDINTFTVLVIGKSKNYTFDFRPGSFDYKIHRHGDAVAFGWGGSDVMEKVKAGYNAVKAMFHVFYQSPDYTGGMIDIWHLELRGHGSFKRRGCIVQRTTKELAAELINPTEEVPLDLEAREYVTKPPAAEPAKPAKAEPIPIETLRRNAALGRKVVHRKPATKRATK